MNLKPWVPSRSAMDVGAGDFVKVGGQWKAIVSNTAEGQKVTPRNWTVQTEDGNSYTMWDIDRYAKKDDIE
jgi:hypothetical protein